MGLIRDTLQKIINPCEAVKPIMTREYEISHQKIKEAFKLRGNIKEIHLGIGKIIIETNEN